ncbi:Dabb family protein [Salmonella enterica]|nr:Dabb family protein [Salmonella enterica]ELV2721379.1 Dabb family protein [Salmonella enterica]HDN6545892.1 Dabb family protein [Salmonella enterica subsp. enterica serovar Chester]
MIRHILLVKFKLEATVEQILDVRKHFLKIPFLIHGIESVEWGENNSPEGKNEGYTHCIFMTFRDELARQQYLPHEEHIKLKNIFRPIIQSIIVFDYIK